MIMWFLRSWLNIYNPFLKEGIAPLFLTVCVGCICLWVTKFKFLQSLNLQNADDTYLWNHWEFSNPEVQAIRFLSLDTKNQKLKKKETLVNFFFKKSQQNKQKREPKNPFGYNSAF